MITIVLVEDYEIMQMTVPAGLTRYDSEFTVIVATSLEMARTILIDGIIPPEAPVWRKGKTITEERPEQLNGETISLTDYRVWGTRTTTELVREMRAGRRQVTVLDTSTGGELHMLFPDITCVDRGILTKDYAPSMLRQLLTRATATPEMIS